MQSIQNIVQININSASQLPNQFFGTIEDPRGETQSTLTGAQAGQIRLGNLQQLLDFDAHFVRGESTSELLAKDRSRDKNVGMHQKHAKSTANIKRASPVKQGLAD